MKNPIFFGNGKMEKNSKISYTNAHLYYKGLSIIIDYEKTMHAYSDELMNDDTTIPFEIYPYADDLYLGYAQVDPYFGAVDISEVLKQIDEALKLINHKRKSISRNY